jgi:hypothetical protein
MHVRKRSEEACLVHRMSNEAAAAHIRLIMCSRANLQAVKNGQPSFHESRHKTQANSVYLLQRDERVLRLWNPWQKLLAATRVVEDAVEVQLES